MLFRVIFIPLKLYAYFFFYSFVVRNYNTNRSSHFEIDCHTIQSGNVMSGIYKIAGILFCAVFCTGIGAVCAQNSVSTLVFDAYEWDTGTIREVDGVVSRTFTFTNVGDTPIAIERVKVDCGCTALKYDTKPVAPGKKGSIDISFNPDKYSGTFRKLVTIFSNEGKNRNVITITGSVIGRPRSVEDDYPFELGGGIRAAELHKAFGFVENATVKSMVIQIVNNSPVTAHISVIPPEVATAGFSAAAPVSLAAGEKGDVTLTYDLTKVSAYGMFADRFFLSVNGAIAGLPINVNAIGVDNFGKTNSSAAPNCEISPVYHNFGEVKTQSAHTIKVKISNTGKSPLYIRDVTLRRNTECSLLAGEKVMPGKSLIVSVTLRAGMEYGVVAGGITLVVNDPERPFREIRLGAEVI